MVVRKLKTFKERLLGWHLYPDQILLLETRFGIHTFLLKSSIDVLVLSNKNLVVKVKPGLKPNRVLFWNPKYHYVVELPNGYINKHRIKLDDKIQLKPS